MREIASLFEIQKKFAMTSGGQISALVGVIHQQVLNYKFRFGNCQP
jgi:hypothetical protein